MWLSDISIPWDIITPELADGCSKDFEWQQVSFGVQGFLSILADLNNNVVWMV